MSEAALDHYISEIEKMEGKLEKMVMPTLDLRVMVIRLRQDMLGMLPFLEVQKLIIAEEEPQG